MKMALCRSFRLNFLIKDVMKCIFIQKRFGSIRQPPVGVGKFPWESNSFKDRQIALENDEKLDEDVEERVNIGLPFESEQIRTKAKRNQVKLMRSNIKDISLTCIHEDWLKENAVNDQMRLAFHYDIYEHLFGKAFFAPVIQMKVDFQESNENKSHYPVFRGNFIAPEKAQAKPSIQISGQNECIYTLLLTSPDEAINGNDTETLHWSIANIEDCDISTGTEISPYLPPFPARGTGFHRYIFILYQHKSSLDLTSLVKEKWELKDRQFSTLEFYRERQDEITPVGLSFFQSAWDDSVRALFHNVLNMKDPQYEYDWPHDLRVQQEKYPIDATFNRYLDRYRDRKEIKEQIFKEFLNTRSPYQPPRIPEKYPNAYKITDRSSWEKQEIRDKRLRIGKYVYWPTYPKNESAPTSDLAKDPRKKLYLFRGDWPSSDDYITK